MRRWRHPLAPEPDAVVLVCNICGWQAIITPEQAVDGRQRHADTRHVDLYRWALSSFVEIDVLLDFEPLRLLHPRGTVEP